MRCNEIEEKNLKIIQKCKSKIKLIVTYNKIKKIKFKMEQNNTQQNKMNN